MQFFQFFSILYFNYFIIQNVSARFISQYLRWGILKSFVSWLICNLKFYAVKVFASSRNLFWYMWYLLILTRQHPILKYFMVWNQSLKHNIRNTFSIVFRAILIWLRVYGNPKIPTREKIKQCMKILGRHFCHHDIEGSINMIGR